jgi:ribonuclease Z
MRDKRKVAELILLGSAGALPDKARESAYMVLRSEESSILIDCGGSPLQRLQRAGIDLKNLDSLIVTHHHPDHIYGVPALLLGLWLLGREKFQIFGPKRSVSALASIMDALEWQDWPCTMPVAFNEVEMDEGYTIIETEYFHITSSPVVHLLPTIAIRITSKATGKSIVYSSDTEPCESLVRLGMGADVLIHESTGDYRGHSTASQAGEVAKLCGAKKLVLIHFPKGMDLQAIRYEAEEEFGGPVELAEEFSVYPL